MSKDSDITIRDEKRPSPAEFTEKFFGFRQFHFGSPDPDIYIHYSWFYEKFSRKKCCFGGSFKSPYESESYRFGKIFETDECEACLDYDRQVWLELMSSVVAANIFKSFKVTNQFLR